tara:strand:+ start:5017 stop:5280 length:264 start_codon:yes stop_codon:yes gene_type:complete
MNSNPLNDSERLKIVEEKVDEILSILKGNIQPNCEKMGSHIDFVENVYDNVKNPLGFLCSKINILGGNQGHYTLEDTPSQPQRQSSR